MTSMGNFISLPPDYFEVNARHFVDFYIKDLLRGQSYFRQWRCHIAWPVQLSLWGRAFPQQPLVLLAAWASFPACKTKLYLSHLEKSMWEALCLKVSRGSQAFESTSGRASWEKRCPRHLSSRLGSPGRTGTLSSVPTGPFLLPLGCPLSNGRVRRWHLL